MTRKIRVIKAEVKNALDIERIRKKTWLVTYPNEEYGISKEDINLRFNDLESRLNHLIYQMEIGKRETFVAKVEDKIVGFSTIERKKNFNEIYAIYILPRYQNKGIGSKLLKKCIKQLGTKKEIRLRVADYNIVAIAFYEKWGFYIIKNTVCEDYELPNGKTIPVVWMKRDNV